MKKKIVALFTSAVILMSVTANSISALEQNTEFTIKIVHTNDIHARVEENAGSSIIGMSKLKSVIDDFTDDADMDLVLDSGDLFHGQSIATLVQGESIARLVKACEYDAMTAGNHDWNYGKDRLKELADMADVEMLTGNVVDESGNQFFDNSYYIESVDKNGENLKVGVFGVIDPSIYNSTSPANVEGLTFTDSVEYSKTAATELKNQGCDIVIALTHTIDPVGLAESVNDVDLWLAGHEHIDINTTVTTPDGSKSYVIEDGYYLYQAGLIELDCEIDSDGDVVDISCNREICDYTKAAVYEDDPQVSAVLEEINSEESVILDEVVGVSPAELNGDWYSLRIDETNLGRAVTDAYLLETGADIAFENAGGIRASVAKGDVTYGDIIGVSPYGNYIVTKQITGKELLEVLETSIEIQKNNISAYEIGDDGGWPSNSGSYLQAGGITVEYNLALDYGNRVLSVKVGNEPLDKDKLYTVAMNNFLAVSSDYPQFAQADETGEYSACDEALIEYFKQDENITLSSVTTERMIKTDKVNPEIPTENPEETTASTEPDTTESTVATVVPTTQLTTATADTINKNQADNGVVNTGSSYTAVALLILISATALGAITIKKSSEEK